MAIEKPTMYAVVVLAIAWTSAATGQVATLSRALPTMNYPAPPESESVMKIAGVEPIFVGPPVSSGGSIQPVADPFEQSDYPRNGFAGLRSCAAPGWSQPWTWQLAPDGLIYRSYMAGVREPRMGVQIFNEKDDGALWDATLGGRVALIRHGTCDTVRPEGFEIDVEGAAFPRLDPENNMDLNQVDFRAGLPITFGVERWQVKTGYYHLSSHLGDEYLLRNNLTSRNNFSRDALLLGGSYYAHPDLRLYAEADWAFYSDLSESWAFQFGVDYSPITWGDAVHGAPFVAVNGHLREELNFSGNFVLQAGWQWRGASGHVVRTGLHYFNGLTNQYSLYTEFEQQIGGGVWYDY
jgi:hypothetical protein